MAFYVSPPSGTISLQRLTQFAYTRFTFLCKIIETKGNRIQLLDVVKGIEAVEESECLIEGTCKDRISHAILRLACCDDPDMSDFLLMAETLLFDFRFSCMTKEELCKVLRSTDRYRKLVFEPASGFLQVLSDIRDQHSSWREVVKKYLIGEGYFYTSYLNVLHLVAKREVILHRGLANVPFHRLREVTTDAFRRVLSHGLKFARSKFSCDEGRIVDLVKALKVLFRRKFRGEGLQASVPYSMLHTEVDRLVERFPPCMAHLHRVLRRKHRLNHHARVQYTLFLKEAGLSVHEALMFWRLEYSQEAQKGNRCGHDWASNEKRYTYNIRHLYGLEGSRINYRGHSCAALQENYNGPLDEGGCPFIHFDKEHLEQLLTEEGVQEGRVEILNRAAFCQPSETCKTFHNVKIKNHLQERNCKQDCVSSGYIKSNFVKDVKNGAENQKTDGSEYSRPRSKTCQSLKTGKGFQMCWDIENIVPVKTSGGLQQVEMICNCTDIQENNEDKSKDKSQGVLQDMTRNKGVSLSHCLNEVLRNAKVKHSFCDETMAATVVHSSTDYSGDCDRFFTKTQNRNDSQLTGSTDYKNGERHERCESEEERNDKCGHLQRTVVVEQRANFEHMDCDASPTDTRLCGYVKDNFSKPVDFYLSYIKLVQSLQSIQS